MLDERRKTLATGAQSGQTARMAPGKARSGAKDALGIVLLFLAYFVTARVGLLMDAVAGFASAGRPVLGICNGFQVLLEAGLLPGAMLRNRQQRFNCSWVHVRVENPGSPWLRADQPTPLPYASAEAVEGTPSQA